MFIVSCALQIGVGVEERKESGTTKCYKASSSRHRSREPSRIGQKYKQGVQKSLKMRRLFKKYVVGVVPKSSKLFKFSRRRIFREEYICFKYYFACNQRRKEVFKGDNCYIKNIKRRTRKHKEGKCNSLFRNTGKDYTEVFLDCNHKYCWCKRVLSNDVEINPGPSFANYINTVRGTFDQGNQLLFGNNAGNQCVANSLIAVVFNTGINCFLWDRGIMDRILHIGNSFYGYLKKCTGTDRLLLSELSIDNECTCYILTYGESMAGEVNMLNGRDCYFSLFEALSCVRLEFSSCLLTIECNTVAIFFRNDVCKLFDPHARDIYGDVSITGTSVLLEFNDVEKLICYIQEFYSYLTVAAFELRGIDVVGNSCPEFCGIGSEERDENNMVKVVTYSYFGSDLKKDVIGYNDCTKRGDIKNVKEETLHAVTVGESLKEREFERVENSIRTTQTNKKGKKTNIDGFVTRKILLKSDNIMKEMKRRERDWIICRNMWKLNGEKKQTRKDEPDWRKLNVELRKND